ncbi:MAG: deoxyribose-phosphate aldolase [Eubacteriaceae bacterium]|nr:deoxyribose-phosphate aldolase [Eubacteriaceae bacterium]
MNNYEILSRVDHTNLKADSTWEDIEKLCFEAVAYKMASVCVPPVYVKRIQETFGAQLAICTVIGFPLGYSCMEAKIAEIGASLANGAAEFDVVVNISDVKNRYYNDVAKELTTLRAAVGSKILKVIIETCLLDEKQKIMMCEIVTNIGADYIKTSTGFSTGGAVIEDIELFKLHIGEGVKIKASGGIRTREQFEAFIDAGAERIGASGALAALGLV